MLAKVSKVVFEFYDTISTGSYSISKISGEVCPENNCTKPGNFSPGGTPTKVGITVQQKKENWPGKIPNGFIALESKEKGLVIEVKNLDYSSLKKENLDKIIEVVNNQL